MTLGASQVSFVCTYARPTRIVCMFLEKPCRVEWLGYFWVEILLNSASSGLGLSCVLVPILHHVVTLYCSCCTFTISMENRDLE
jgi:hypothetical protein